MSRDFDIPFIENPNELNINLENVRFNRVKTKKITTVENHKVYDLEVNKLSNYHTSNGMVHNGGGKL